MENKIEILLKKQDEELKKFGFYVHRVINDRDECVYHTHGLKDNFDSKELCITCPNITIKNAMIIFNEFVHMIKNGQKLKDGDYYTINEKWQVKLKINKIEPDYLVILVPGYNKKFLDEAPIEYKELDVYDFTYRQLDDDLLKMHDAE